MSSQSYISVSFLYMGTINLIQRDSENRRLQTRYSKLSRLTRTQGWIQGKEGAFLGTSTLTL